VGSEFESAATGPGLLFHRVGAIVRTGAHSRSFSRFVAWNSMICRATTPRVQGKNDWQTEKGKDEGKIFDD